MMMQVQIIHQPDSMQQDRLTCNRWKATVKIFVSIGLDNRRGLALKRRKYYVC